MTVSITPATYTSVKDLLGGAGTADDVLKDSAKRGAARTALWQGIKNEIDTATDKDAAKKAVIDEATRLYNDPKIGASVKELNKLYTELEATPATDTTKRQQLNDAITKNFVDNKGETLRARAYVVLAKSMGAQGFDDVYVENGPAKKYADQVKAVANDASKDVKAFKDAVGDYIYLSMASFYARLTDSKITVSGVTFMQTSATDAKVLGMPAGTSGLTVGQYVHFTKEDGTELPPGTKLSDHLKNQPYKIKNLKFAIAV